MISSCGRNQYYTAQFMSGGTVALSVVKLQKKVKYMINSYFPTANCPTLPVDYGCWWERSYYKNYILSLNRGREAVERCV